MSTEQNKVIARRYIEEIWSDGKLETADEIINEDFIFHGGISDV
jgi:hypothetical protein